MRGLVRLPTDPLIDYLDFCDAIAEAVWPTVGIEGIQCIVGKIATFYPSTLRSSGTLVAHCDAEQGTMAFDHGYSLGEFLTIDEAAQTSSGALTFPCPLTDADRQLLNKMLPDLPPLRSPMSEEERAAFMTAYCAHPSRPAWMPDLVTEVTISRSKSERAKFKANQHRTMQQEVAAGRLVIVDGLHTPVRAPTAGTFIPRAQAVAFLERFGFRYCAQQSDSEGGDAKQRSPQTRADQSKSKRRVGEFALTLEQQQAAFEYYESQKIAAVKKTAEKFGVSRKTIYTLVKKMRQEREERRIDKKLARSVFGNADPLPTES